MTIFQTVCVLGGVLIATKLYLIWINRARRWKCSVQGCGNDSQVICAITLGQEYVDFSLCQKHLDLANAFDLWNSEDAA
jgi:hypothetical protein